MQSVPIPFEIEKVWSVNETFRAIVDAREQGLEPSPELRQYFMNNIGVFAAAQEIIVEKMVGAVGEAEEDALKTTAYDALAEAERGEDAEDITLRALHKLEDKNTEDTKTAHDEQEKHDKNTWHDYDLPKETYERARTGDVECITQIIKHHERFVQMVARQAAQRLPSSASAIDFNDLVQEGNLGLLYAIGRYDTEGRARFMTYAGISIKRYIHRHIDDMQSTIRVPTSMRQKMRAVSRINWYRREGSRPLLSNREIADLVDVHPSDQPTFDYHRTTVGDLKLAELKTRHMGSLDNGFSPHSDVSYGNGYVLDERQGLSSLTSEPELSIEDKACLADLPELILEALSRLSEREQNIIMLRFGLGSREPMTLEQIGALYNLTRDRIRQIEVKALEILRHPVVSGSLEGIVDRR